jgi:hypothetical protein
MKRKLISRAILLCGIAMLIVGLIGGFSPWTYDAYIWLFPEERLAYANAGKGGPYPEIGFLMLAMIGFFVTLFGRMLALTSRGDSI